MFFGLLGFQCSRASNILRVCRFAGGPGLYSTFLSFTTFLGLRISGCLAFKGVWWFSGFEVIRLSGFESAGLGFF